MDLEWDPAKARANIKKHGVHFEEAARVFLDEYRIEIYDGDRRGAQGEDRWKTIGLVGPALLVVVYTVRGANNAVIRLISARKADLHEKRQYLQTNT